MDDRLIRIRESEKRSHTEVYSNERLYNSDSWLNKAIKTVRDVGTLFSDYKKINVLDLGSGVGRNSIYLAELYRDKECRIDCVDLLEIAIDKLKQNATVHGVGESINGIVQTIEDYEISESSYDLIMAVSALEHVDSRDSFATKLEEIKSGIRPEGVAILVINSAVRESDVHTLEELEPQLEVNLPTDEMLTILDETFRNWSIVKNTVVNQEYEIPRDGITSRLQTNVITYVVRKPVQGEYK